MDKNESFFFVDAMVSDEEIFMVLGNALT